MLLIISFNTFSDVVVDLSKIGEGQYKIVDWQNLRVIVFHRTESQIKQLNLSTNRAAKPASTAFYARLYGNAMANALRRGEQLNEKQLRSFDDKWFVAIGFSPESGAALRVYENESVLMDPSDGILYDLTGRVIDDSSTKRDLSIPEYKVSDQSLTIYIKPSSNDIDYSEGRVNRSDPPEKQVIDAINWRKFQLAKVILDTHPNIINSLEVNVAILAVATIYGDKELLEKAIKYGGNVNVLFKNNSTPLNTALISNHMDVAKYLVNNGASLQKICHPKYPTRCSTSTWEVAKMIEGVEADLEKWVNE